MRTRRGSATAVDVLLGLVRVVGPLIIIGVAALWFLNRGVGRGRLRVTSSTPGATILLDGMQTGYVTDTTLTVTRGRRIITVRMAGLVSDPEFAVAEVRQGVVSQVSFDLRTPQPATRSDTIPPLRHVRQEVFSTGEPVRALPPAPRGTAPLIDFTPQSERGVSAGSSHSATGSEEAWRIPEWTDTASISGSIQGTKVTVTSVPDAAEIVVNGAPTPRLTPYTFRGLDRGIYSFRVRREGFTVRPDSVVLALNHDYQQELAAFDLQADTTLPRPTLTVTTSPLAAAIRVNGKAAGMGKVSMDVAYGTHRIEFGDAPGYQTPAPVSVLLTTDQPHADVTGTYQRRSGNAYIAVEPAEEFGAFDGSLLRVYVDNELLVDGPKQRFDVALISRVLSGKRLVRVQYGDLTSDLHLNVLDGDVSEITLRIESFFSKRKLRLREKPSVPFEEWQQKTSKLNVLTAT
jgi:hypothetical protein